MKRTSASPTMVVSACRNQANVGMTDGVNSAHETARTRGVVAEKTRTASRTQDQANSAEIAVVMTTAGQCCNGQWVAITQSISRAPGAR